jgi:PAS domain S-box-containing protein
VEKKPPEHYSGRAPHRRSRQARKGVGTNTVRKQGRTGEAAEGVKHTTIPVELSAERFQAVVQSISDGVMTVDREWRITCFNRAAEEITGYRRCEVLGRLCYEVLRSDLCQDACPIQQTLESGRPVAGLVVYITDAQGQKIPVSVSTALYRDTSGRLVGGVESFRDLRQIHSLRKQVESSYALSDIISRNPRVRELLEILPVVAESGSAILIRGETGTGKELLARAVHNQSDRRDGPFVAVNCACFPETLVESELFGYEKGAFTGADRSKAGRFARAEDGTLFLDEIGSLPLPVQAKLLRVLQNKTYEPLGGTKVLKTNTRIVTATNQDLEDMVQGGAFRQDLYYRINVIELKLPPLRERPEDFLPLIRHFLGKLSSLHDKPVEGFTPEALRILMAHSYPGNIRELENVVEHAYVLATGPLMGVEHLPVWLFEAHRESREPEGLEDCERRVIRLALERCLGDRRGAAAELGVHKSTLYRKMKRLGLTFPEAPRDSREEGSR